MTLARVGQAASLLPSGKVLIAGGWVGHGSTDSAELYDPATGKFIAIAKMTARRGRPSATLLANGDVLIAGGADHDTPGGIASAELFHASTLTFEPLEAMHQARISHTATLLGDGRVLIAGGRGESGVTASAELYDPQTKHFAETGNLLAARYKHTAGVLPDGRVVIGGGSDDRDWRGAMNSAEIYDPRTGKFTATSPLNDSRFKLPEEAAQLASGQLLVSGGSKKVEIYDPQSGKFTIVAGAERRLALHERNAPQRRQSAPRRRLPEQRPGHIANLDLSPIIVPRELACRERNYFARRSTSPCTTTESFSERRYLNEPGVVPARTGPLSSFIPGGA
jgi:hypothetical protein